MRRSTIHTFAPISATLNRSASTFYTKQIPNTQPSQWHSQQATSARSFLPSSSHLLVSSLRQVLRPYRTKLLYTNKQTARLRCRSPHQHPVDDSWLYPWHHSRSVRTSNCRCTFRAGIHPPPYEAFQVPEANASVACLSELSTNNSTSYIILKY